MKLYLDDLRSPPEGWVLVRTVRECVDTLKKGDVTELSLDHDLDSYYASSVFETGYDVLCWLESQIEIHNNRSIVPSKIHIHTMNPSGAQRMRLARENIYKLLNREEDTE